MFQCVIKQVDFPWSGSNILFTVISEIFARILFTLIAFKFILVMRNIRD